MSLIMYLLLVSSRTCSHTLGTRGFFLANVGRNRPEAEQRRPKADATSGLPREKTSHRKSESVMVTPKKCKFLQLCEHQLSVKVTPTWCTFTPQ